MPAHTVLRTALLVALSFAACTRPTDETATPEPVTPEARAIGATAGEGSARNADDGPAIDTAATTVDAAPGPVPATDAASSPSAPTMGDLWAQLPEAEVRVVVDATAWNATLSDAAWNPFGRDLTAQATIWQRLVAPIGVTLHTPETMRTLAMAWSPEGSVLRTRGTGLSSRSDARVRQLASGPEALRGQDLPPRPTRVPTLLDGRTTLAVAWTPSRERNPVPALDGVTYELAAYTDGGLSLQFVGADHAVVAGELGRAQVFASHALGQLRSEAPVELQGFVTLLTRWHEALWAATRLEAHDRGPRWVIAPARCGDQPRAWMAAAMLAGLVTAAQHDEAAAPRPPAMYEATVRDGCAHATVPARLPSTLAALADMNGADRESLLLMDLAAWVRAIAPDAGGLLPFALTAETVAEALGARPLGLDTLQHPAPIALWWEAQAGRQTRRTAVLPAATARWLGDAPLFEGTQPLLLDAERLILAPTGSNARERLVRSEAPAWTAIVSTASLDSRAVYAVSPPVFRPLLGEPSGQDSPFGAALRASDVLAIEWLADGGWALRGGPSPSDLNVDTLGADVAPWLRRRAVAVLPPGVAGRADTVARLNAMEAALTGAFTAEVTGRTWVVRSESAMPWVRALIDVGIPAIAGQIDRGAIGPIPAPEMDWPSVGSP